MKPSSSFMKSPDQIEVLFENEDFLVLDKPSGWIVNESGTTTTQPVVQEWLKQNLKYPISESREMRSGVVHRLDKETSGILLVAKNEKTFTWLQSQFKERKVHKKYLALAHGEMEGEGVINAPVGRLPWRRDRFGVFPGGREAETKYLVKKVYERDGEKYSLVELEPKTGRTHQIRIHLKYLGHPIVADDFYAGRKTARKERLWCPRLFLHASEIDFTTETGEEVHFVSELASDLDQVLKQLTALV